MSRRQAMEQYFCIRQWTKRSHNMEKCWRCFQPLQDEKMRYQEKQFHLRCFNCDMCKVSLKDKRCHEDGGKLYDENCWTILQEDRCSKCKTIIKSDIQKYRGKNFHAECFSCASCNQSLVGVSFNEDDGRFYHEECFRNLNAYVCDGCKKQIDGNDIDFMLFQGKYFHNRCFACDQCRQSLTGGKFKMMMGKRYCTRCR